MYGTYQFTEQRACFIHGGSGLKPRPCDRLPCLSPSLISSVTTHNYRRDNGNHSVDVSFQIHYNSLFSNLYSDNLVDYTVKGKGKAVPLQAWTGPEGSRKLRLLDFVTTAQDGDKVVSLTHRPLLPSRNTLGTHFC
jgi:hypothetical protein